MKLEDAIKVLEQAVELAQSRGIYSLTDATTIFQAINAIKVHISNKENDSKEESEK